VLFVLRFFPAVADIFSPAKRSQVMSRIRSSDTKPEILLRSMLHRMGYRFTVRGPGNKKLPGRPDIVLPRYRCAIFVHGCFWHCHENCRDFKMPRSRRDYWIAKLDGNRTRDDRNQAELKRLGWNVITIWACSLETEAARNAVVEKLAGWIETRSQAIQ
jgi:DNA mismatch endonuclease (patch repair protein)